MNSRLKRLQHERHLVHDVLIRLDMKIRDEKLRLALKDMAKDRGLMKALERAGGK